MSQSALRKRPRLLDFWALALLGGGVCRSIGHHGVHNFMALTLPIVSTKDHLWNSCSKIKTFESIKKKLLCCFLLIYVLLCTHVPFPHFLLICLTVKIKSTLGTSASTYRIL
ncbi:hypothetical protein BY996DRAFT_8606 [Phakopsora pachyrhizi]|nr:hypothetical protein BY996DRAFT_8606 [Phakopsora pachyrhizi]